MRYTRMHGAGNTFLVTEDPHTALTGEELSLLARRLCDARTGPGADGLIVLRPGGPSADLAMLFYNADGSLGEMCGNGARCVARYAWEHGLAPDPERIRIRATAGLVTGRRLSRERYQVRLNEPSVLELRREVEAAGRRFVCGYVELGEPGLPHAVVEAAPEELDDPARLRPLGRALRYCAAFPKGANVSFYTLTGPASVRAITFERGVEDFTPACGTGCGAMALSLLLSSRVAGDELTVDMPGGQLRVELRRDGEAVRDLLLTGPTAVVGVFDPDDPLPFRP